MTHPYGNLPPSSFWRRSVDSQNISAFDPVVNNSGLRITAKEQVMTAGSCFAQHIARHLRSAGFGYMITERPHPAFGRHSEGYNYGTYTARYGNIYTPRQLLQLIRRSSGAFDSSEDVWRDQNGGWIDPFRPQIQPNGFSTAEELRQDRIRHLDAVNRALRSCDVLVFTLGLTEAWVAKDCGTILPICPGVSGGTFDSGKYEFRNLSFEECLADLQQAIAEVKSINPDVWILLTVSPVPLVATAMPQHVAVATSYSKSVLRVVADRACELDKVVYFPSFEVITSSATAGRYWATDLREVDEIGVQHAMSVFFRHFTENVTQSQENQIPSISSDDELRQAVNAVEVECDQIAYDNIG